MICLDIADTSHIRSAPSRRKAAASRGVIPSGVRVVIHITALIAMAFWVTTAARNMQISLTAFESRVHRPVAECTASESHLDVIANAVREVAGVTAVTDWLAVNVHSKVDRLVIEHCGLVGAQGAIHAVRIVERRRRIEVVARVPRLQRFGQFHAETLSVVRWFVSGQAVEYCRCICGWKWKKEKVADKK